MCAPLLASTTPPAVNLVANPGFEGTGGVSLNVAGAIPDHWRGFSVGGSAQIEVIPLAGDAVYAGSPATNAVRLEIHSYGSDQGFDNDNARFKVFAACQYQLEFYVRTGNADNSNQSFTYSFPLFDSNGKHIGQTWGSGSGTATGAWTKISGPLFTPPIAAAYGHIAFRAPNNGGQNSIMVALPAVQGPPERFQTPTAAELADRPSWTAADRLIATTYFYWYRWPDRHFFNADNSDALTHHFVNPQAVSMDDKNWHKQEAADAIDAGIDMLWPVYWGAPGNFDHPNFSFYWEALAPLQEALDELIDEGQTPPKIGMFYDTSTLLNGMRGASPSGGLADLTTPQGREIFYDTIRSFFCNVRPRHWACIDGRPIVVLYVSAFAADYDQTVFDEVNARFAADFEGITPYIIRDHSWDVVTDSDYRWGAALRGPYIDGIASLGPGYDDTAVPGRSTPIRHREDGNYYRWSWLQVLQSPANIVHIETWNEMHEATEICESLELGRQYIELTAHYAAHFKAGTVPDETVTLEYPDPEPRPPNMEDGQEYAGARFVEVYAQSGQRINAGLDTPSAADGTIRAVNFAGSTYLRTDVNPVRYGYFAMKDPFYFDQRRRARITLEYLDHGTPTVQLEYDSYDRTAMFEGSYTQGPALQLNDTGTLMTWTVVLDNARFANRQNAGADFRFYVENGPLYFKRVRVDVLDLPEPVLRVNSLMPPPGSIVPPPIAVTARFTADVDPASVTNSTFRLVGSGGDGNFGTENDVAIQASSYSVSGNQAVFHLAGTTLPRDVYRVKLVGRGAKPILDGDSKPLDGKFDGTFPSGDGTGGEDFIAQFIVSFRGDSDNDGDVDQEDFGRFQACLSGLSPYAPGCEHADFDHNGAVDSADTNVFLQCMRGPNVSPGCD